MRDRRSFSFRAECGEDAAAAIVALFLHDQGLAVDTVRPFALAPGWYDEPDRAIEIATVLDYAALRAILDSIDGGHVMAETLRGVPLLENPLTRDFGVR